MNTNELLSNLAILGLRTGANGNRDYRIPITEILVLASLYKYHSVSSEDVLISIEKITDAIGSTVEVHGANMLTTTGVKNIIQHLRNNIVWGGTTITSQRVAGTVRYQVQDINMLEQRISWILSTTAGSEDVIWVTFMKVVDAL